MTLADMGVMVAAVAVVMTLPWRASGLYSDLPAQAALLYFGLIGGLRLSMGFGLVLAFVVIFRHARYGGWVRPAGWLALVIASLDLLNAVPNLDEAVNAYYAAVGSTELDFGVARWLISAPAAAGAGVVAAGLVFLRRRARFESRFTSVLTAVGILCGLFLWFWGPCEAARLQLPWLLIPSPAGNLSTWGWRAPVVLALRDLVANAPIGLTCGLPAAATVRGWRDDRRRGRARGWIWTEWAAIVDAVLVALATGAWAAVLGPPDLFQRSPFWILSVGLLSWWISGLFGNTREPADAAAPSAS
jgi:hypothetical protein